MSKDATHAFDSIIPLHEILFPGDIKPQLKMGIHEQTLDFAVDSIRPYLHHLVSTCIKYHETRMKLLSNIEGLSHRWPSFIIDQVDNSLPDPQYGEACAKAFEKFAKSKIQICQSQANDIQRQTTIILEKALSYMKYAFGPANEKQAEDLKEALASATLQKLEAPLRKSSINFGKRQLKAEKWLASGGNKKRQVEEMENDEQASTNNKKAAKGTQQKGNKRNPKKPRKEQHKD